MLVEFAPDAAGDFAETLTLQTDAGDSVQVQLTGRGVSSGEPGRISTRDTLDFGPVPVGTTRVQELTVTNSGAGPLSVTDVSSPHPGVAGRDEVGGATPVLLAPGTSRTSGIALTAGAHANEQAGVCSAVELVDTLETDRRLDVVPTRDPVGLDGYETAPTPGDAE